MRNWIVIIGILSLLPFFFLTGKTSLYRPFFVNTVLAVLCGLSLWYAKIWAAGDGKFFIFAAMSSLFFISDNLLINPPAGILPVFIILCNAFILALLYLLLEAFWGAGCALVVSAYKGEFLSKLRGWDKRIKRPQNLLMVFKVALFYIFSFTLFVTIVSYARNHAPFITRNYLLFYLLLIFLYAPIYKILRKIPAFVLFFVLICFLIIGRINIGFILLAAGRFFVILGGIRSAIFWYNHKRESTYVVCEDIRPGLVLSAGERNWLKSEKFSCAGFFSDGLTVEQAQMLRERCQKSGRKFIQVYYTFPFVPFILLAAAGVYFFGARPINIFSFLLP